MKKFVLALTAVAALGVAGCHKNADTGNNTADVNATAIEAGNDVNASAAEANATTGNAVTTTGNAVDATGNAAGNAVDATGNAVSNATH